MKGYWIADSEKNVSLSFQRQIMHADAVLKIAAADCYQIFFNGKFIGFGPARAAHGYAREDVYRLPEPGVLTIVASAYGIQTFWLIRQAPFVHLELEEDGTVYREADFICNRVSDRRQKVQRYSYQRAFTEDYVMRAPRKELYGKVSEGQGLPLSESAEYRALPTITTRPLYRKIRADKVAETGGVLIEPKRRVWRDRAHTHVGQELDGYAANEWEHSATDDASHFVYLPDEAGEGKYAVYDLGRSVTGFAGMEIKACGSARVYLIFDEIVWTEEKSSADRRCMNISFYRNTCSNCFCWELGSGEHDLLTFEPYVMRYMKIVVFGNAEIRSVGITEYCNPDADRLLFSVADGKAQAVVEAARQSFAQNAVDLLTDCPSRERAGWLADSYFTSVAERLFTGGNAVEKSFLENYAEACCEKLPSGMIPMCYPADCYDSMYIPNYAMWYVLEVLQYCRATGDLAMAEQSKEKILGIVRYFTKFENEYGLLEDLEGWIFIEWSEANEDTHTCGVNYPSNMCWYACLNAVAELYGMPALAEKAGRLKEAILHFGFDGEFFADNSVRAEGALARTVYRTEVCQYYAFWFGIAAKENYAGLYGELMEHFGANRAEGYRKDIAPPNAIFGIYMRLDLMKRDGMIEKLYEECRQYFYPMAARTGTLWEHRGMYADVRHDSPDFAVSCDHGFASYAATWLVYALCGYNGKDFEDKYLGIDCEFYLPEIAKRVIVRNGKREII